jgi:predicted permease
MLPGLRTRIRTWTESLSQDARFAARVLGKSRTVTAVSVLSLALGLGVNLSIFTFVNALVLAPIPGVADSAGLVAIHHRTRHGGSFARAGAYTSASYPDFEYYRRHTASFRGLAAHTPFTATVRAGGSTERVAGELVSDNYFVVLGGRAAVGRLLDPRDATPGAAPTVVLSHAYWQRSLGGDADIVGRTIHVGSTAATVAGVASRGFRGLVFGSEPPALWLPVSHHSPALLTAWGSQSFNVTGRQQPGVTLDLAQAEMQMLAGRLDVERAASGAFREITEYARLEPVLIPAQRSRVQPYEQGVFVALLGLLGGVAILILLIATFNVANVVLARAVLRQQEIAVRSSLGATWRRVVQQLAVENLLLSLLAAAPAIPVAMWTSRILVSFGPSSPLAILADARMDGGIVAAGTVLVLVTGLLLSLLPARVAARANVSAVLVRYSRGTTGGTGAQSAMVAAQVALSVVLLVGAGLFVRTLLNALATDVTPRPERVLLATLDTSAAKYDEAGGIRLYAGILDRVRALATVEDAAQVFVVPLGGRRGGTNIEWTADEGPRSAQVGFNAVSTRHFQTIGVPIVAGRDFTDADRVGSPPVAIVNQVLADRLLTGRDPLGARLAVTWRPASIVEVVGVVRDGRFRSYRSAMEPTVYVPLRQRYLSPITLEVRTADPLALVPAIRRELAAIDPNVALTGIRTARDHFDDALWRERLMASLVGGLGVVALALVAIGLYGILSFVVAQRTREIGVRMALGARLGAVLWLVLRRALVVVGAGAAAGALASAALARHVRPLLFGVSPADPRVVVSVVAALVLVTIAAAVVPARRAARVDPVAALRAE